MILPWQTQQWQQLWHAKQQQRLPHALLLSGIAGMGKAQFADVFARSLLCQAETKQNHEYCGKCHSCRLTAGRAHPNVLWIEPEEEGHAIKIDAIRDTADFTQQSSMQGEHRLVIINPADNLNHHAANALLKTLEEPAAGAILILISHQNQRLPQTVRSRCQRITFARPAQPAVLAWLKEQLPKKSLDPVLLLRLTEGAPLAALQLAASDKLALREKLYTALYALSQKQKEPIQAAEKLYNNEPLQSLDFILSWLLDVSRLHVVQDNAVVVNSDYIDNLVQVKQKTELNSINQLLIYTQQLRRHICTGINFNKQLMLENIFIRWQECVGASHG